ncbi:DNA primase [Entomoplasma ellychniae]|uniref:DNA primase n=1 Tax=Entomoplasma ellychniae TaxID=2114 RepID=A0A8E2QZ20_9MOLU|nr:DNA primase [Entomoplasma ellychniae]PPE05059.1 DNA primase [Entomoplasma ellychniae]
MLPKEVIDDIVAKTEIVSVVGERITLVKKGRNFWAVCPFHQDTSPSMSVSNEKRIYKCFSCQESGNVIEFVKKFDNISFNKAIEKIAKFINFDISQYQKKLSTIQNNLLSKIYKLNSEAMSFFKSGLATKDGKSAIEYLKSRNINLQQIDKFNIGYISKQSNLAQHLMDKGFELKDIIESGLGNYDENNKKIKNIFSDRIIFAITDEQNNVIGFSGRKIEDKSERPKYLNTKETEVFQKRKIAYNFLSASKNARIKKEIIILEGYMDVISMCGAGIDNVIALMGTSLSSFHIKLFKTIKDCEVKIFLDGDKPGVEASIKAASLLIANKIKTSIVYNITTNDPDELINQNKKDLVLKMISESIEPLEFVIKQLWKSTDSNNYDSIAKFISLVANFVLSANNQILYDKSLELIQDISKVSKPAIIEIFKSKRNFTTHSNKNESLDEPKNPIDKSFNKSVENKIRGYQNSENAILQELLKSNQHLNYIKKNISDIELKNQDSRHLIQKVLKIYENNIGISSKEMLNKLQSENSPQLNEIIESIINSLDFQMQYSDPLKRLDDAFIKIKERHNEEDIFEIKQQLNKKEITVLEREKLTNTLNARIAMRKKFKLNFLKQGEK